MEVFLIQIHRTPEFYVDTPGWVGVMDPESKRLDKRKVMANTTGM